MVSDEKERRDFPAYALDRIRELALEERVDYGSLRVESDISNLGYSAGDVCQCIAGLDERHFHHSERPIRQKRWQDVYRCRWFVKPGSPDDLYVKLMLSQSTVTVVLCSFHRPR